MLGAQAAGAKADPPRHTINRQRYFMNIWHEAGAGATLRVADVVAPHPDLAANLTFHGSVSCLTASEAVGKIQNVKVSYPTPILKELDAPT